jgi:hypothetical protein
VAFNANSRSSDKDLGQYPGLDCEFGGGLLRIARLGLDIDGDRLSCS